MNLFWLISVGLVVVILLVFTTRYRTAKPDQAMIVTGARIKEGMRITKSGGVFVWPIIQNAEFLSLQVQTLEVRTPDLYTRDGVPVTLEGVAQIKVKGDVESISVAAENFLGKPAEAVGHVAIESLEGYLRANLAQLSMDEAYKQREQFANKVRELAENDLQKMGLQVVTFTIKDVKDKTGYLQALGMPHIVSVKRDAEIVKANALRDEQVARAKALEESKKAEFLAESNIAEAEKDMEVKKTAYQLEQVIRKVEAEETVKLKEVKMLHNVKTEEWATQIMEKEKLNELEAKEIERRERLEASMKKSEALVNAQKQQTEFELYQIEGKPNAYALAISLSGHGNEDKERAKAEIPTLIGLVEEKEKHEILEALHKLNGNTNVKKIIEAHPSIANNVRNNGKSTNEFVIDSDISTNQHDKGNPFR